MSPRNNNIIITFRRKYPMQATLAETHVTLLSSTKGVFKEESIEGDSIVPMIEYL